MPLENVHGDPIFTKINKVKKTNFRKNYKDSSALKTTDNGNYIIRTKEDEVKFVQTYFI